MRNFWTLLFFITSLNAFNQSDTCLQSLELGISFPPVSGQVERNFTKPHLDNLGVQKIRIGENWKNREPSQGNFNWSPLEDRLFWADNNHYKVLLTIQSNGPSWACSPLSNNQSCVYNNNTDFKNYLDSLLIKYGDKIDKIQFGNEWQSDFWYIGNANDFVEANNILYHSVQENAPHIKVVLGGFTTISLRFMAGCNGFVNSFYDDDGNFYDQAFLQSNCNTPALQNILNRIDTVLSFAQYDILDIHLYDDSDQWDEYYYNFIDTITKPIIVSEFGGPNINIEPNSDNYQMDRLYSYIKKLDSLEISEAYFFKLVEGTNNPAHATSGLIDGTNLNEKPIYYLFKSFIGCSSFINNFFPYQVIMFQPNPMTIQTTIQFKKAISNEPSILNIFNINGKIVRTIVLNLSENTYIIDKKELSIGTYFVEITNNNTILGKGKLIIQ